MKRYFKLYLQVRGDEVWISPQGTKEIFFLTRDRITREQVENFRKPTKEEILGEQMESLFVEN